MNSGKCKDCKFWLPPANGYSFGYCDGGIPDDDERDTLAYILAEGDSGLLRTKPEFGCAMFVIK